MHPERHDVIGVRAESARTTSNLIELQGSLYRTFASELWDG